MERQDEIIAKLGLLAKAIGGNALVLAWDKIEEDVGIGERERTFARRRVREARDTPAGYRGRV